MSLLSVEQTLCLKAPRVCNEVNGTCRASSTTITFSIHDNPESYETLFTIRFYSTVATLSMLSHFSVGAEHSYNM